MPGQLEAGDQSQVCHQGSVKINLTMLPSEGGLEQKPLKSSVSGHMTTGQRAEWLEHKVWQREPKTGFQWSM